MTDETFLYYQNPKFLTVVSFVVEQSSFLLDFVGYPGQVSQDAAHIMSCFKVITDS